ncbi:DUF4097 family beta strand repeat protein [Staphylococcus schleiferi]|uniref:DUF4097 family beta strand repeat-containing protein n=1 Tax=Staphylococcus schleiferi TaxID=1295 RepID=UPI001886B8AA|nr:DUF4097 family beta strand repeat-containing protein [Staphylococcus schleiferi]MBF1992380.1 DUF4097 family beta strand repeat protein [Staphylococcus schleiferi]MBF2038074.1 DUF4097 family beta strand repeat protein [Staphylococcus schleiferi]MBF2099878.1 DUF4097 family beta strand repeat protein [Staphylococcus schleiferi]MBF2102172.1 DUF4097 family beta strand repeat protein [Staphylococcus schleiferi]MBF2104345.1 DUF4097 family beta strand repeat protein [Staphylococcus schleiferi]
MKKLFIFGLSCFLVSFILGTIVWFGFEKKQQSIEKVEKTYAKNEINQLIVNMASADVKIVEGKQFHVTYKGKEDLSVSKQNKTLNIAEIKHSRGKEPNLNPFNREDNYIVITAPSAQLKELNVSTGFAKIQADGIDSQNAKFWNERSGEVTINHSQFSHTKIIGHESLVNIHDSHLNQSEISVENGQINANRSALHRSIFKIKQGNIVMNDMETECDFKGSTQKGNIDLNYRKTPHNVMLSLNPEHGHAHIKNQHLKHGKNGKGEHKVELYTNHGDITVD